jgi:outer membrane protein assembly factor BamE (lipoprotein component of BamABCDE complex)
MAAAALRGLCRGRTRKDLMSRLAAIGLAAVSLGGCLGYDGVVNRGAVFDQRKLAQVKQGMLAPQVLSVLGTPSTTSTVGGDAWYYVSQRTERDLAFMQPKVTDQHVAAVYFDKDKKVQRIADYGLEDGKAIDFVTRTMPTPGAENNLITGLLKAVSSVNLSPF